MLLEWNDCRTAYPREACIHDLVAEWAERTPEAIAVVCGEASLSYRELDERAGCLARRLRGCGVGPDVRVAVLLERSAELVVALLAVLKAGGAFVPLDPGSPQQRLAGLLEDAGARVLISGPGFAVRVLSPEAASEAAVTEEPLVLADHLAYVMFTSGTTGRPKGVAVPHRAVVRLVRQTNFARLDAREVLLLLAPVSFDASTLEIWGALANGGRLVVYPGERPGLEELGEVLERHGVSTLWLTAGLFHQMVERNLQGLRPVRQLLAGGDVLSPRHVRAALDGLPGCTVINGYGPTENTTFTCCHPMTDAAGVGESVPIGRPIANSRAVVVDRDFHPVPVGVPGELLAGGDGLARGYLGRPDLTAERFIPDPTAGLLGLPGDRAYRTGDLVRLLPDGRFDFLGRIDQQVKIRGFRIEPGEIEAALGEHPAVASAVVVARPARDGVASDRRLVAYVVLRPGMEAPMSTILRGFLRERLPESMIPTAWLFVDELPLTPRGKVDRTALPEPGAAREETFDLAAPRTPTEEVLAGFWSEVLGGVGVGVHDSFFELGGHSLLATQVISWVREAFGVELPLRRLFERPTLGGFAEAVDDALRGEAGVAVPGVEPVPRSSPLPLSFAQRRLWFLDQLAPGSPVYNVPFPLLLTGNLDAAALQRALSEVTRRHEALRTTFAMTAGMTAGEPRQVIAPPCPVPLPRVDLAGLPQDTREAEALRLLREDARAPFDLAAGPLLRALLLRLAPGEHWLLPTLHHIVADGWSMEILLRELAALYRGTPLADLPVQYADFAVWQQRWLAGETLARQLDHWRRQLAGVPAAPELPADHPRPAMQSQRGALLTAPLPPDLAAGLRTLCRQEGVTLFMAALAGLDTLLLRHTGQEDLTVGSVVANRNRAETEGLIGFFVNTLVLRTDLAGDPAFRTLLARVRETALAAYAHQDVPFETLVEELQPERDLARTPFFQILIHHIRRGAPDVEMAPGLCAERLPADTGTAKFDLSLTVVDSAEAVELHLEYATDLFDATTVLRVFGHLTRLLAGATPRPDLPLSVLPLLGPEEAAQLLVDWNDTARDFSVRSLVHEQVEKQARHRPEAVAVAAGQRQMTYGELVARAHRLAHHLRSLGVAPETRVAVLMEHTPERVVGILAVLEAGGAYVSLDPAHPRERLAFQIADAAVPVVLTQGNLAARLPAVQAEVLILDGDWSGIHGREDAAPSVRIEPGNLAYVVYTSGSTGTPKGVEIPHAGLANLVAWHREEYTVTAADRATLVANPAFDASVWEVWPYLTAGASLHILEEEVRLAPAALSRRWAETGITLSFLPTPLAEAVLEEELPAGMALRALIVGGDRLRRGQVPGAGFRLMNHYGPSESSVVSTMGPVEEEGIPAIGRPIANTRVYVLDAGRAPVPVGVPGELWVAGAGLARGYLARPDLTAERFLPDPWVAGERTYRTGDRVRWRPQGNLDFLGRLDHQVKVRGLRIELGEIEAALLRLPCVREAVVLTRKDAFGDLRLVAWVVPAGEEPPAAPGELRRDLLVSLPEYMVPSAFVVLTELPLTPNCKLDRQALPAPEPDRAGLDGSFVRPRGPVEELVAGIWCEVLGCDRVGADAPFFDLGGHSLLAIQVVSRLRGAFGVDLPVRALFEATTVSRLAERIAAARSGPAGIETPALRPMPRDDQSHGLPLSFAQGRLWLLDRLAPGTAIFNVPQPLTLRGPLDRPAMEAALTEIVRRHEVLRTMFREHQGAALQVIRPVGPVALPVSDLEELPAAAREAETRRLADLEARLPFDLAAGPLLRTALLRLSSEEHVLLLTIHHIVTDGWSMAIFTRELRELYAAFAAGRPSPLPELPLQYADFAVWQRRSLDGRATAALVDRWRERFGTELPVLSLPTERPRPPVQTNPGAYRALALPPELSAESRRLARRSGATLFMTLLAAFQALLARYTGQERIVVGSPVAGRDRAEIEGLIGFFVNSLVLPADLTGDPTFAQILDRVRGMALDAYAFRELPFDKLVEALQPERDRSRSPLFQVMFALESDAGPAAEAPLAVSPFPASTATSQFDLTLYMTDTSTGLRAVVEYNTDLFDAVTIERLLEHYRRLLAAAVADPGIRLSALPPCSEELPRPTPMPEPAARTSRMSRMPADDPSARRARLLERRGQLSEEQRRLLEQRLRGASLAPPGDRAVPAAARCLVEITPAAGSSRPPFFCIHPAGGDVLCFFPLARRMGPDQPFFGFQARGLEDDAEPFATLEAMAAHYVSEMRRVQPAGPYRLGGWSFGGLAAYEMARQLSEQGEEVTLLAVLDTAPGVPPEEPAEPSVFEDDDTPWLVTIAEYVRGLRGADLRITEEQLARLSSEERLRVFVDRLRAAGIVHAGEDGLAQLRRLLRVFKTNARAFRSYRPRPYPGPIALFRAAGTGFDPSLCHDLGWGRFTPSPVEVHEFPGDHISMMAEPDVAVLAERLRACLDP
ncbi:MAG TPA: amino acid adenylation domain-containing protein [Thermoanaerobaculia bacterium]|nr:amino acid adenylation domain-containing protein [Thermoanaerobaculia bacterium]